MWLTGIFENKRDNKIGIDEFHEIFTNNFTQLVIYAAQFVGHFEVAKDIVQDVFSKFWSESEKLNDKSQVKSYLYSAVKHKALNYNKREKKKTSLNQLLNESENELEDFSSQNILMNIAFVQFKDDLEAAINELPKQRQKIFRMSRYQQMKHKQIAKILDISPKTVETQIYRSLKFLREKLSHHFE